MRVQALLQFARFQLREGRRRLVPVSRTLVSAGVTCVLIACGNSGERNAAADSESARAVPKSNGVIAPDTASRTLATAAGPADYHVDENPIAPGTLSGSVRLTGALPVDSMITPNRDSTGCRPFEDTSLPSARGVKTPTADSADHTIGNAVVWLAGVTHGPAVSLPRRVGMMLDGCHLEPRVLLAPVGATIMMGNRDELIADLRLADHDVVGGPSRDEIGFTDPGQLVPTSKALSRPGLVEVRDAKHPWIRGFVAVAPHPFVAVTGADGAFAFDGVPAGSYQLVVWHERLGARVMPVKVEQGIATVVTVSFGAR